MSFSFETSSACVELKSLIRKHNFKFFLVTGELLEVHPIPPFLTLFLILPFVVFRCHIGFRVFFYLAQSMDVEAFCRLGLFFLNVFRITLIGLPVVAGSRHSDGGSQGALHPPGSRVVLQSWPPQSGRAWLRHEFSRGPA